MVPFFAAPVQSLYDSLKGGSVADLNNVTCIVDETISAVA